MFCRPRPICYPQPVFLPPPPPPPPPPPCYPTIVCPPRKKKRKKKHGCGPCSKGQKRMGVELKHYDRSYKRVKKKLLQSWRHNYPKPTIKKIYRLTPSKKWKHLYTRYRAKVAKQRRLKNGNEHERWHGTDVANGLCGLGKQVNLCIGKQSCPTAQILKSTLQKSKQGLFGAGIYLTRVSSKAHGYTGGRVTGRPVPKRGTSALILMKSVLGRQYRPRTQMRSLHDVPSKKFDSIGAKAGPLVGSISNRLLYDEDVVYHRRATLPAYWVVYRT